MLNTYRIQNNRFIKYLRRVTAVAIVVPLVKIKTSTILPVPTKVKKRKTLKEIIQNSLQRIIKRQHLQTLSRMKIKVAEIVVRRQKEAKSFSHLIVVRLSPDEKIQVPTFVMKKTLNLSRLCNGTEVFLQQLILKSTQPD